MKSILVTRFSGCCLAILMLSFALQCAAAETENDAREQFPGRDLYPTVPYIELEELKSRLDSVVVVDVRTPYEYETLRIKGAINISLSAETFVAKMRELRGSDPRQIVVYCNGRTCMKSYKAALKCAVNKIDNVHSFDAGVMDWVHAYPEQSALLGKSPVDPLKLISKKEFTAHLLTPDAYGDKVASSTAIVLDVRDRFQREGVSLFVGRERRAYLDDRKRLDRFIQKAKKENRVVLIHDAAGKQVRWLQYYLKDQGLEKYYFMQGGIAAYYEEMKNEFIR